MESHFGKRAFLTLGLGLGVGLGSSRGFAQSAPLAGGDDLGRRGAIPAKKREISIRKARTTKLFLTPPGWPNAIAIDPDGRGFWIAEQRHDGNRESVWLVDWNGKLLHTLMTNCQNTSGMSVGDGCIWSGANGASIKNHPNPPVNGIFQTDFNGNQISHRQIPFGPPDNGGACHGVAWQRGKLWISSNRLESLVRLDPRTWQVEWMFPHTFLPDLKDRIHGIEYDEATGFLWQVSGTQSPSAPGYGGYTPALIKYDISSGEVVEIVEFEAGSCDAHDIAIHQGVFYGVDAGEHPGWPIDNPAYQRSGWPPLNSPFSGYVFKIDFV